MNLSLMGNPGLRLAIQHNLVSFPSQIPALMPGSDDRHERIACLYFMRGWPLRHICARYSLSKAMAHHYLSEWRLRAIAAGYIQEICPEDAEFPADTHRERPPMLCETSPGEVVPLLSDLCYPATARRPASRLVEF